MYCFLAEFQKDRLEPFEQNKFCFDSNSNNQSDTVAINESLCLNNAGTQI